MKYSCVVLAVKDIDRARRFYEEMFGLEIYQDYGINIGFKEGLALQQEFDWLVGLDKEDIKTKSNNIELCFETENITEFIEKLEKNPEIEIIGTVEHTWGQKVVRFYDLDDHIIEVGENMKMVIERFLKQGKDMEEISKIMDASPTDLNKLLNE